MKRFLNILRMIFLSPEFLCIICFSSLFLFKIDFISNFAYFLFFGCNITIIFALPIFCFSFTISQMIRILQPKESLKLLVSWKDYSLLEDGVWISLSWCIASLIVTILLVSNKEKLLVYSIGIIYITFNIVAFISTLSTFRASFKVREILEKYGS